ncbi:MAG TPA: RidA family protein [Alphaproteobacteria bacterium]|nr:RidA family protein [Alphaproteobacteria bacterium]
MKLEPIHHVPLEPSFRSPFSAAYAIEGGRLLFFSGCCTIPTYHKHPHDAAEERKWLEGDFRAQTERTFTHIREILRAAGGDFENVLKLNIFVTRMEEQNVLNEISARCFGAGKPPARTLVGVPVLAHPDMMIEIDGVAAVPARAKGMVRSRLNRKKPKPARARRKRR